MATQSAAGAGDTKNNTLIQSLLQACKKCTIDIDGNMENSIKAIMCICTKSVDKKKLVALVTNNMYVDWQYLQTFYAGVCFGNDSVPPQTPVPLDTNQAAGSGAGGDLHAGEGKLLPNQGDTCSPAGFLSEQQGLVVSGESSEINLLGSNTLTWLQLADHLSFPVNEGMQENLLRRNYPPLWCIYNSLRDSRVLDHTWVPSQQHQQQDGRSSKLNFSDVCKLCLLHNIESLPCKNVIEQYMLQRLDRNQHTVSANILSALADQRNSSEVYFTTTKFLMGIMRVDAVLLGAKISHYKKSVMSQQQAWVVKFVQAGKSRPSMRDVLNRVSLQNQTAQHAPGGAPRGLHATAGSAGQLAGARSLQAGLHNLHLLGGSSAPSSIQGSVGLAASVSGGGLTTMSFDEFCRLVRFPNSMSRLLRLRCYLLASQSHQFDYREKTGNLVSLDVAKSVNSTPVVFPDPECLRQGIETLTLRQGPFEQLNQFRQRCFVSFSINQQKVLNLTQILHLYVAAYQKPDVWKQVWKGIFPVMSTQISKDVESFVYGTAFAADEFVYLLKHSTPFVG